MPRTLPPRGSSRYFEMNQRSQDKFTQGAAVAARAGYASEDFGGSTASVSAALRNCIKKRPKCAPYKYLFEKHGSGLFNAAVLCEQAVQESGCNPTILGPMTRYGRAGGFVQFIESTWNNFCKPKGFSNRLDADDNLGCAVAYDKFLYERYATKASCPGYSAFDLTFAAYNSGPGYIVRCEFTRFRSDETRNYVASITKRVSDDARFA